MLPLQLSNGSVNFTRVSVIGSSLYLNETFERSSKIIVLLDHS